MKNIQVVELDKFGDAERYAPVTGGIYRSVKDPDPTDHRLVLSFESEESEGQYPLEDLLDEYMLYVSDHLDSPQLPWSAGDTIMLEFAGEREDVERLAELVGRRVFIETTVEDGEEYQGLGIE